MQALSTELIWRRCKSIPENCQNPPTTSKILHRLTDSTLINETHHGYKIKFNENENFHPVWKMCVINRCLVHLLQPSVDVCVWGKKLEKCCGLKCMGMTRGVSIFTLFISSPLLTLVDQSALSKHRYSFPFALLFIVICIWRHFAVCVKCRWESVVIVLNALLLKFLSDVLHILSLGHAIVRWPLWESFLCNVFNFASLRLGNLFHSWTNVTIQTFFQWNYNLFFLLEFEYFKHILFDIKF